MGFCSKWRLYLFIFFFRSDHLHPSRFFFSMPTDHRANTWDALTSCWDACPTWLQYCFGACRGAIHVRPTRSRDDCDVRAREWCLCKHQNHAAATSDMRPDNRSSRPRCRDDIWTVSDACNYPRIANKKSRSRD